jgi:hypothetical protein
MDWRETAAIPGNASPDVTVVDSISAAIPGGQQVLLACKT